MPLIGIIAKKNDVEEIKRELKKDNIETFEITKESIKNIRNIKFEEIIIMKKKKKKRYLVYLLEMQNY